MDDIPGFESIESDADRSQRYAWVLAPLVFPERYSDQERVKSEAEIWCMLGRRNCLGKKVMADALIMLGIEPCMAKDSQLGVFLNNHHEERARSLIPRNTIKEAWALVMDYNLWLFGTVNRNYRRLNPAMSSEDKVQILRTCAFYAGLFYEREKSGFQNYFLKTWAWGAFKEIQCNRMVPIPIDVMERAHNAVNSDLDERAGKGAGNEQMGSEKSLQKREMFDMYRELRLMAKRGNVNVFDIEDDMAMRDLEGRSSAPHKIQEEILAEPIQEAGYLRNESAREIRRALRLLDNKDRLVLDIRFGLGDMPEKTLKEVGRGFGRSRETARNYETNALRKMRILMCE